MHGGNSSYFVTARQQPYSGPRQTLVTGEQIKNHVSYATEWWVKLVDGAPSASFNVKFSITYDDGSKYYQSLIAATLTPEDGWRKLSNNWRQYLNGSEVSVDVYAQANPATANFLLDDIVIQEVSSDWEKEANERIEEIRKRDMLITVRSGTSLSDDELNSLELALSQMKPGFPFGTCVVEGRIVDSSEENIKYSQFIADNFNYAVFENGMKWRQTERQRDVFNYDNVDASLDWLESQGLTTRGHNVFWGADERFQPDWVKPLKDEDMWEAVNHRVNTLVKYNPFI